MVTYTGGGPGQSSGGISNDLPVYNGMVPKEGPKAIPYTVTFGTTQSFTFDLQNAQARGVISSVQTVFIDNSANSSPVKVTAQVGNQTIICPALSQGYFAILAPNPPVFTASSVGTGNVQLIFMNVQVPDVVWNSSSSANIYDANGNLKTSDQNLVTAISGGYVAVKDNGNGTSDTTRPKFNGNFAWTGHIGSATTVVNVVTGNPSYFLTNLHISLSDSAALAIAGDLTVSVKDGTTTIATAIVSLATTSSTVGIFKVVDFDNMNYNAGTAANVLTINLSPALSAGTLTYNILGGITSITG